MTISNPTIIFQDESFAAINKPAGITVNRADTTKDEQTLQDWAEKEFEFIIPSKLPEKILPDGSYNSEYEFFTRGGIVHRLDKETSGIILIAKNPQSFAALKEQFLKHQVKKTYVALAHGKISPVAGEINAPVGRLPYNRTHFGVLPGGREAVTLYKVIDFYEYKTRHQKEYLTFVELSPKTGRTHQIRVHLKYINHPIFGDELYAGRKTARDDRVLLPRVFLHARAIRFAHPKTQEMLTFEAPLSNELSNLLSKLTKTS